MTSNSQINLVLACPGWALIKRFTIQIIIRILILAITSLLFAYFFIKGYWFTVTGIGILITIQVWTLIEYVNQTNYSLVRFLTALKNQDHSVYFSPSKKGRSFAKVFEDFNKIIQIFKQNKIEKEVQFRYFKQILEQINLGIISLKKEDLDNDRSSEEFLFLNRAASEILDQPRHKYWHRFEKQVPWFATEIRKLSGGGRKLVNVEGGTAEKRLALEVANLRFSGIPYLIITFQDIHSEIEQKEMEAWHNVIRVLAHEMLNSFTPVSSLASTIESMTENEKGTVLTVGEIEDETIEDINLAAETISRRSEGLLDFVNDYRTISKVPVPQLKETNVKAFLAHILRLMQPTLNEKGISMNNCVVPSKAFVLIDPKLIEQVFINIIGNAIYALENTKEPVISFQCRITDSKTTLSISDNGKGIEEDVLSQIFIPFYTTRKDGSGIGLSLSKSIMKEHGGQLLVNSEVGVFTTFSLVFNRF
ncbi:MAG: HAMP domain-containing histidine kinase [Bacteroidetes bacterium]|nr:HAMP domain-containing histidine kinase [Bacteroidota bacterium]